MRKREGDREVKEETPGVRERSRKKQESGKEGIGAQGSSPSSREPGSRCGLGPLTLPHGFPGASKRKRRQQGAEGAGVGGPVRDLPSTLLRQPPPAFPGCSKMWRPCAAPPWAPPACTGKQVLSLVLLSVCAGVYVCGWGLGWGFSSCTVS